MNRNQHEGTAWDRELDSQLEQRLRLDAVDWSAEPSTESLSKLQTRLADIQQAPRRLPLGLLTAAALMIFGLSIWALAAPLEKTDEAALGPSLAEGVVSSLQRELDAVTADANAVADRLMKPFSGRMFGLLAGGD